MDWYCSATDGIVSDIITNEMLTKGWKFKFYSKATP